MSRITAALLIALLIVAAGCGEDSTETTTPTGETLPGERLPTGAIEIGVPYRYGFFIHCGMEYLQDVDARNWSTGDAPYNGYGTFPDELRQAFSDPLESISPTVLGTIVKTSENTLEFRVLDSDIVVPYTPTDDEIPECD